MIRSKSNSRTNSKDYNTLLAKAKAQFVQGTFKNVQFMLCEFSAVTTAPKAISKIPQHAFVLTVFRLTITKATILGTSKLHRLFVIVAIMSRFINSPFAINTNKTAKSQLFVVKHNRLLLDKCSLIFLSSLVWLKLRLLIPMITKRNKFLAWQ